MGTDGSYVDQQYSGGWTYGFSSFTSPTTVTVELKLTNGEKLVDTFDTHRIYDIREKTTSTGKKHTQFRYMGSFGVRDKKNDETYDVDCKLSDLCHLMKISYQSLSKSILDNAVRNGK